MNHSIRMLTRRFRAEWLALAIMLLIIGAIFVWTLAREHDSVESQQSDRLQVQARVVEEDLLRQLEGANKALEGVREDLKRRDPAIDRVAANGKLKLLTDAMAGVSTMLVLDAGGTIVASSRDELIGRNFKGRAYFDVPRRDSNPAMLYVSPPFESALHTFVIVVSRVLTNADGEFAGVVTATLDPAYFKVVLGSVIYAPDMRANLIHADGKMFLNMPADVQLSHMDFAKPGSLFMRHQQSGQETTLFAGTVLGSAAERMLVLRSLRSREVPMNKPLVVAVSRQLSAVYAPWRADLLRFSAAYALLALGLGFGLYFDQRRRTALELLAEAGAKARQEGADRVELALRGANLGLWDLHLPSDTFVADARERELLGYSATEPLDQADWRKLIHPDDWRDVVATYESHLRGETAAQECEHRMRHKDGRWIWIRARATIVERDAGGVPLRMVGTHLDITQRKQADAELSAAAELLRASEEQLREVTDNMPALVSRIDGEQRFRFANRAYGDWLGMAAPSLLGRTLSEVYGHEVFGPIAHHVHAALAGERVVYERAMTTLRGLRRVEVTLVPQRGPDGAVQGMYSLINDITARHDAEQQRRRSEERLNLALEGSSLGLFDWDIDANLMYHSAQTAAMRGEPAIEATNSPAELQLFVHPEDLPAMLSRMKDAIKGVTPSYDTDFRLRRACGDWLWVRAHGRVVERDASGRALRLAGTYADISERRLADEKLRHLAEFDTLTDLPNRALFHDRLQQAMKRAAREKSMALLFLDIDHFKTVNDTLGHEAGDQLLKVFAHRMRDAVRQSDTVARLAGDEFTAILEGIHCPDDAKAVAAKLVETLRRPIALAGQLFEITTSIGVALYIPGETDDAEMLRRADVALYEAKRQGRNRYFCEASDPRSLQGTAAGVRAEEWMH